MTFVCVICGHTGPRADGRPVDDTRYPSWRCADSQACAIRFLARVPHTHPGVLCSPDWCSGAEYEPRHARG